ncbi:pilus assembly protein [Trinickia terrae]|uniref:Pilus assembly protein n=1 Tax=Trinickia terrae TaxID=2571161 RepID=A0A4U1HYV2_9BURK|nr:TadE/TadG family type IV pilus assembly protein [Trinickia terrae]TKC86253.1 pilus assembly protein [Trinickia terrae]
MKRAPPIARRAHERGVASLEFVLMLPFLLTTLFGIIDTSLILTDKAIITNASREAARSGVTVHVPVLTTTQIQTVALNYLNNNLVAGGTASTPTVTVSQPSGTSSGDPLTVTVSYTYNGIVLGSAFSAITGSVTLSAATTMNYE